MRRKIILVGYPGSQKIAGASKYLASKYLSPHFDFVYLNYKGHIDSWGNYVASFLKYLTDDLVIFALDDYLISGELVKSEYYKAEAIIGTNSDYGCAKLCYCTPEENEEYPVTTQYSLWNREYLISMLHRICTPWQFEIEGSRMFKAVDGKRLLHAPCIPYFTNSALSSRWEGVKLDGLSEEDINHLKSHGLI